MDMLRSQRMSKIEANTTIQKWEKKIPHNSDNPETHTNWNTKKKRIIVNRGFGKVRQNKAIMTIQIHEITVLIIQRKTAWESPLTGTHTARFGNQIKYQRKGLSKIIHNYTYQITLRCFCIQVVKIQSVITNPFTSNPVLTKINFAISNQVFSNTHPKHTLTTIPTTHSNNNNNNKKL